MQRVVPIYQVKSFIGKSDKVHITHTHATANVEFVEEIFFCEEVRCCCCCCGEITCIS